MKCSECRNYSKSLRRCNSGKCNPKTARATHETASMMGWSYICSFNATKQSVIAQLATKEA